MFTCIESYIHAACVCAHVRAHTPTLFADMHTGGGILSDKIGRRKSIFVCNVLMGIGSLSVLAWSYGIYVLMRFISGLGCGSGIVVNFVLMMEFTGVSHRGWMGGLGMNGLWAWGGVVIGLHGAIMHSLFREGPAMLHEWQVQCALAHSSQFRSRHALALYCNRRVSHASDRGVSCISA